MYRYIRVPTYENAVISIHALFFLMGLFRGTLLLIEVSTFTPVNLYLNAYNVLNSILSYTV